TPRTARSFRTVQLQRGTGVTASLTAADPLHLGCLAEAPQAEFTGAPLSGSISDWAEQVSREAENASPRGPGEGTPKVRPSRVPGRSSAPTRTARGTSMGGAASAKERAAAGLNPVAGLDISLEDAETLPKTGVTA